MQVSAFTPRGMDQTIATPKSQANVTVTGAGVQTIDLTTVGAPYASDTQARFMVDGTQPIAWCFGTGAGLTYNNGEAMLGNSLELFDIPRGVTTIAVTATAAGSVLRVMPGDGN